MPELPEVEVIAKELAQSHLLNETIEHVDIFWPGVIDNLLPNEFAKRLVKQQILDIKRRGKFLIFTLTNDILLIHLRMTGKILITQSKNQETFKHEHLRLHFSNNVILHFEDQRKFGRWYLLDSLEKLNTLGVEPLSNDFTVKKLQELLAAHNMQVKPFLLNQRFIAGLGNIYVDEALWEAKIHPQCHTQSLSKQQIARLHAAIQKVLELGIANLGTSLGNHRSNYLSASGRKGSHQNQLKVFRHEGKPCPRCGEKIIKIRVAQRGTHLCPLCQFLIK